MAAGIIECFDWPVPAEKRWYVPYAGAVVCSQRQTIGQAESTKERQKRPVVMAMARSDPILLHAHNESPTPSPTVRCAVEGPPETVVCVPLHTNEHTPNNLNGHKLNS